MLIKRSLHKLLHTAFIGSIKSPLSNPSPSWANKFPVFDGSTPKVPFHGNLRVVHSSSLKMPSDAELAQWMTLSFRYISESLIRLLEINVHIVYRYIQISVLPVLLYVSITIWLNVLTFLKFSIVIPTCSNMISVNYLLYLMWMAPSLE